MAGGEQSTSNLMLAERRSQAVQLRLEGHSFREIAEKLGVSIGTAHHDVAHSLAETRHQIAQDCEALRTLEYQRLEELWKAWFPRAIAGDHKALIAAHRNSELRMRLMGLDADKHEEIQFKLQQEIGELATMLQGLLSEETYQEVQRALGLAMDRKGLESATIEVESHAN